MAILSFSRVPRLPLQIGRLVAGLFTSATVPFSSASSPPHLSPSPTEYHLHKAHDPNKTLSLSSSAFKSFSSTSGDSAGKLASRRHSYAKYRDPNNPDSVESFIATVILTYGSFDTLDRAIALFEQIPQLCSAPPTIISFNALLSAAMRAEKPSQVPDLFSLQSRKHSISPDSHSYDILVDALCLSGKLDNALETMKDMEEKGIQVTIDIYSTLIHSLYKDGQPERAEDLWNEMVEKGIDPDLFTYNSKIIDRALHGKLEEVLETISELKAAGLTPDSITYNTLMVCCSSKRSYEDVKQVYEEMKSSGCSPDSTTFDIMLSLLCKNGDFEAGFDLFLESHGRAEIPEFTTVRDLVVGLAKKSRPKQATLVIRKMKQRFPVDRAEEWEIIEKEHGLHTYGSRWSS